jgi:hypothetical protein
MENNDDTTDLSKVIHNIKDNDNDNVYEKKSSDFGVFFQGGSKSHTLDIQLGDIVTLCAPDNPELDQHTFFVEYVSSSQVTLLEVQTLAETSIGIRPTGQLVDTSIIGWNLLSREEEKGYSNIYGLTTKTWVNVYFQGDIPQIIVGQITNVEEDMIEITPITIGSDPFYIDFAYQGIPKDMNIIKIEVREKPQSDTQMKTILLSENPIAELDEANIEYLPNGEALVILPEQAVIPEDLEPEFDEIEEEEYTLYTEIPENEKRYGIDIQTTELLDALLEKIPLFKRTPKIMENIHNTIERYKQVRKQSYQFDENGFILEKKAQIDSSLVESLSQLDKKLAWILPVIQTKKNIYHTFSNTIDGEIPDDVNEMNTYDAIVALHDSHENKVNVNESTTLYDQYVSELTELQQPFMTDAKTTIEMKTDCDVLVSNYDPSTLMRSTVVKVIPVTKTEGSDTGITERNFVVQKTVASSKYISSTSELSQRNFITTQPDKVNAQSIVVLPETFVHYSRMNLPMTNIMTQTELSLTPLYLFSLLKKQRGIVSTNLSSTNLLKDMSVPSFVHYVNKEASYTDLVKTVIPTNDAILSFLQKNTNLQNKKLSIYESVRVAEPYLIYMENVRYDMYKRIKENVTRQIKHYITQHGVNRKTYKSNFIRKNLPIATTIIQKLIQSEDTDITAEFTSLFNQLYFDKNNNIPMTSSEMLFQVNCRDTGVLLQTMISYILFFLITPDKLLQQPVRETHLLEDSTDACLRKTLAKHYTSVKALEKDNGKDIDYDFELDDTPYDVYKKYKKEKERYSEKDFREYLSHSLVEFHNCPPNQLTEIVDTMIRGKKPVQTGDYAVLEETPHVLKLFQNENWTDKEKREIEMESRLKKKYTYYKRTSGQDWVIDTSIQDENGTWARKMLDSVKNNKKNPTINESNKDIHIEKELYSSVDAKMNDWKKKIESIRKSWSLKALLQDTTLNKKYNIEDIKENTSPVSPYYEIRNYILSESDFTRKQQYIIRFYTKFCREADIHEQKQWGYCRETQTKLFPRSLYELAVAYNNRQYTQKLDELVFELGELSNDGDAIVDKYTGYVLKRIDDSTEEGYDDAGFKITTHAVLEKNTIDVVLKELNRIQKKTFNHKTAEQIHAVFSHLKLKTELKDDSEEIETFVMQQSIRFLCNPSKLPNECEFNETIFLSERDFQKQEDKNAAKKRDYKKQTFAIYKNRNIIAVTLSMFLIAIQTSIPGIQPRKTYPNCMYSYGGFPLLMDNDDTSGISFLACILKTTANQNLDRENKELWNSLVKGYSVDAFIKNIRDILDYLVVDVDTRDAYLADLYLRKTQYTLLKPRVQRGEIEEQNKKWSLFLPPLVPFTVVSKSLVLDDSLIIELNKHILHGNKQQHAMLDSFGSKIKLLTFGIVERIRMVLKASKTPHLLSAAFIQNACCNETNITHPVLYFCDKDKEIRNSIVTANKYEHDVKKYKTRANLLYFVSKNETSANFSPHLHSYKDEHIYSAFFHYCNYDNYVPVDSILSDICNQKPEGYVSSMTLAEKINVMKKANIVYNEQSQIHRLMKKIHQKNTIVLPSQPEYSVIESFRQLIQRFPQEDSLKPFLENTCQTAKLVSSQDIDTDENEKLSNLIEFLATQNNIKYNTLVRFLKNNGTQASTQQLSYLKKVDENRRFIGNNNKENNEKNIQFVKNAIKDMVHISPNIIIHNQTTEFKELTHWNFSSTHSSKLKNEHNDFYHGLNAFKDNHDDTLHSFLRYTMDQTTFYDELLDVLPLYSNIELGGKTCYQMFNTTAVDLLLKYVWYSVLEKYVVFSQTDIFFKKKEFTKTEENGLIEMAEDVYDDIQPGWSRSESFDFQSKIADLLKVYLAMQEKSAKSIDFNYATVKAESFKISEREKDEGFVKKIGNMSKEERSLNGLMRKLKLGEYFVESKYNDPEYFEKRNQNVEGPLRRTINENVVADNVTDPTDYMEEEEVGNPQYDPDDMMEDAYGEVRLGEEE